MRHINEKKKLKPQKKREREKEKRNAIFDSFITGTLETLTDFLIRMKRIFSMTLLAKSHLKVVEDPALHCVRALIFYFCQQFMFFVT